MAPNFFTLTQSERGVQESAGIEARGCELPPGLSDIAGWAKHTMSKGIAQNARRGRQGECIL